MRRSPLLTAGLILCTGLAVLDLARPTGHFVPPALSAAPIVIGVLVGVAGIVALPIAWRRASRLRGAVAASRTAVAVTLAAMVLFVSACGTHTSPPPSAEHAQVASLRALPVSETTVATATHVLRDAGVDVVADDASITGGRPIRLTQWQVRNMAVEAANGGGVPADALTSLAPVPAKVPPLRYLITAWLQTYDSSGARFARELMGSTIDAKTPVPNLVLTLFLADATATPDSSGPGSPAHAMALAAAATGGPCTVAATFIQHAIADVAAALKANAGSGLLGFLGKIWNQAVDLASAALTGLVDTLERPVVNVMADVFGVVAVIAHVSSFLTQWRAELRADPSHTRFGVDSEQITGQFVLSVTHEQLPIPQLALDCAEAAGVDLRSIGSPAGSTVDWTATSGLARKLSADTTLATDNTARYKYQTRQESAELAQSPLTESPAMFVSASVARNDIAKVRELFTKLLFDQIPATFRAIVESLAQPLLAEADSKLRSITDVRATASTYVTFHTPPTATPTPATDAATPAETTAVIPASCPSTIVAKFGYHDPAPGPVTAGILWSCGYIGPSNYQLMVGASQTVSHSPSPDEINVQPADIPGADAAWTSGHDTGPLGANIGIDVVVGDKTLVVAGATSRQQLIDIAKAILGVS